VTRPPKTSRPRCSSGADPQASRYGRFAQRLTDGLQSPALSCASAAQLRQLVAESLQQASLTGWSTTDAGGYDAQRPCASLSLDSDTRTVTLSPIAR
jgi:hypothetical protein